MKAILWTKYGNADVLKYGELPKPEPKKDELLIKVKAFTVNRTDCAMLTARMFIMRLQTGLFKPGLPVLGTDFAGVVEAVGDTVDNFKVGDRVFGFDDNGVQSHAEYLVINAKNAVCLIPENTSYEEAAASIEGPHYAYNMINKVDFKEGDEVFVHGGTGGIGSGAVQLSKHFGGIVTATCRPEHTELVKALGADRAIDYTQADFLDIPEKYDYVFDAVGKSTFGKSKKILKPNGVYISSELGPGGQNLWMSLVPPGIGKKQVKFPLPLDKPRSVRMMQTLLAEGKYKPLIDRTYPLEQTPEAFDYVLQGQKVGNVVVKEK